MSLRMKFHQACAPDHQELRNSCSRKKNNYYLQSRSTSDAALFDEHGSNPFEALRSATRLPAICLRDQSVSLCLATNQGNLCRLLHSSQITFARRRKLRTRVWSGQLQSPHRARRIPEGNACNRASLPAPGALYGPPNGYRPPRRIYAHPLQAQHGEKPALPSAGSPCRNPLQRSCSCYFAFFLFLCCAFCVRSWFFLLFYVDGFALVMRILAAQIVDMQRYQSMIDKTLEKLMRQVDIESADHRTLERHMKFQPGPSGKIDHHT